jgi:hypothetical protein
VLMEAKSTTSNSIGLKLAWLIKIAGEARMVGKTPALAISFVNEQGVPYKDGDWILLRRSDWENSNG